MLIAHRTPPGVVGAIWSYGPVLVGVGVSIPLAVSIGVTIAIAVGVDISIGVDVSVAIAVAVTVAITAHGNAGEPVSYVPIVANAGCTPGGCRAQPVITAGLTHTGVDVHAPVIGLVVVEHAVFAVGMEGDDQEQAEPYR
jgi:hypothetical protein